MNFPLLSSYMLSPQLYRLSKNPGGMSANIFYGFTSDIPCSCGMVIHQKFKYCLENKI
jgi:hypothetical protein